MRSIACALIGIYLLLMACRCQRRYSEDCCLLILGGSFGFTFFAFLFMIMGK